MFTKRGGEIAISVAVLLLSAVFAIGAHALRGDTGYAGIGAAFAPTWVALLLAALGMGLLFQSLTGGFRGLSAVAPEPGAKAAVGDKAGALWVSAGILAMATLMKTAGFVIAAVALFVCVARGFGSRRWLRDVAIGASVVLPVYWLFSLVLDVSLPQLIGKWL